MSSFVLWIIFDKGSKQTSQNGDISPNLFVKSILSFERLVDLLREQGNQLEATSDYKQ